MDLVPLACRIVSEILVLAEEVSFNKLRCRDLSHRCEAIGAYLKRVDTKDYPSMTGLLETLVDCKKFLIQMNTSGLVAQFLGATTANKKYELLKENLEYWRKAVKEEIAEIDSFRNVSLEDVAKDDHLYDEYISQMKQRLKIAKALMLAEKVKQEKLEGTVIDCRQIQKGKAKGLFALGAVYEGVYRKKKVIIKEIDANVTIDRTTLNMIKKGVLLNWCLKDCDYIMNIYGIVNIENTYCIVCDMTRFGPLNEMFAYDMSPKDKISITRKIAAGIAYIHECDIVHKDIQSRNIMIDDNYEPKITGFEMSRESKDMSHPFVNIDTNIQRWWSPERKQGLGSSKASDVYAFGMLMYEISMFRFPEISAIPTEYGNISETYSDIMKECLNVEPLRRPSMKEVVIQMIDQQTLFNPEVQTH